MLRPRGGGVLEEGLAQVPAIRPRHIPEAVFRLPHRLAGERCRPTVGRGLQLLGVDRFPPSGGDGLCRQTCVFLEIPVHLVDDAVRSRRPEKLRECVEHPRVPVGGARHDGAEVIRMHRGGTRFGGDWRLHAGSSTRNARARHRRRICRGIQRVGTAPARVQHTDRNEVAL